MKKLKKSFVLLLIFTLCACNFSVLAANSPADYKYYHQLNETEKLIYDTIAGLSPEMFTNENNVKNTVSREIVYNTATANSEQEAINEFAAMLMSAFHTSMEYVNLDNSVPFWIDIVTNQVGLQMSFSVQKNQFSNSYTVKSTPEISASVKSVYKDNVNKHINQLANAVSSIKINGTTRYEKIKNINDLLCNTITYGYSGSSHDVYGALIDRRAVCEGYSRAFKLLCEREGIPCVLVGGYSYNAFSGASEEHMWNYVLMEDGKWYAVDVTWADQKDRIIYDYFLAGSETTVETGLSSIQYTFSDTHVEGIYVSGGIYEKPISFPKLSQTAYDSRNTKPDNTTEKPTETEEPVTSAPPANISLNISGNNVIIDNNDGFISSTSSKRTLREFIENYDELNIKTVNKAAEEIGADDIVGTGTSINIYDANNTIVASYTFIIMGDVTGDGAVTASDARWTLRHAVKIENLDAFASMAGDVLNAKNITVSAARKILRAAVNIEAL